MSRASVVARGRQMAARGMVDTCVVRHQTGTAVDPDTGKVTPTYTDVYTGACRVQFRGLATQSPTSGQQRVDLLSAELQLPIAVTQVLVNDVVEVTTSLDPDLPGRLLRIKNLMHGTHKTARRLQIEEVTS